MLRFYLFLWLEWIVRMFIVTLLFTSIMSLVITLFLYISREMPPLSGEIYRALFEIFRFWFLLLLNIAIPLALFINVKYLFNSSYGGICLRLLSSIKDGEVEVIDTIGYGDLVQVWRRWLFYIVLGSSLLVLLSALFTYLFTQYDSLFDWFSVYTLYLFVTLSGLFSIVLLTKSFKALRLERC